MRLFLLLFITLFSISSYACRLLPVKYALEPTPVGIESTTTPSSLTDLKYRITRGRPSNSGTDSCASIGFVTIYINPSDPAFEFSDMEDNEAGFQFEIVSTNIQGLNLSQHTKPLIPRSAWNGYQSFDFHWDDGRQADQEPVSLTLNIYAVKSGKRSEACKIELTHPGGTERTMDEMVVGCSG